MIVPRIVSLVLLGTLFQECGRSGTSIQPPVQHKQIRVKSIQIDGASPANPHFNTTTTPVIKLVLSEPVLPASLANAVKISDASGTNVTVSTNLQNQDSVLVVQPGAALHFLSRYTFSVDASLKSASGGGLVNPVNQPFITKIDSTAKFPIITDDELLTLVQRQTFKYFWDFAHPVSGLTRERNTSGDIVTSGGSGFGLMAIVTAINRNFISRAEGLARMKTIVGFLTTKAKKFHGAFPHWLNGATGDAVPFSTKDNGADLVETSYLVMGLLTTRQYFSGADAEETALRTAINALCNAVEWSWFRKGSNDLLYWHWSENYNWDMNMPVRGWNECLIIYVLAASSPNFGIPKAVYTNGWAGNGSNGFTNGNQYLGITLPLGPAFGGPLFFSHYSFLGINPKGLTDVYADYWVQNTAHTQINYKYCQSNPKQYFGYSDAVWGLTASDIPNGYSASAPGNDLGVIAPTAALSSMPYAPAPAMKALKFYYYTLGDKLWKDYGFIDAFSLNDLWFASSFLAIDQGPIIVMIENYRSGLIWNLFTSCTVVKAGMKSLGFTAPYL